MILSRNLKPQQKKLMQSIDTGDLELVKKIIKDGCDPNFDTGNAISSSPLYFSVFKGNLSIVKWLIEEGGAKVSIEDVAYFSENLSKEDIASYIAAKYLQNDL